VTQSKTQIAALALRRQVGVSWKAAWLLHHKLMEAMRQREATQPLAGDVSIDDVYLGEGGQAAKLVAHRRTRCPLWRRWKRLMAALNVHASIQSRPSLMLD
jgi:hypothetical protein